MNWLPKTYKDNIKKFWQNVRGVEEKTVRARTEKGRYVADDPSTPDIDEAYTTVEVAKKSKKKKKKKEKKIMATAKDALHQIQSHEKECAIRYQNIEKRLDEGSEKFKKLENMLWGVYPFIVGAIVLTKFI